MKIDDVSTLEEDTRKPMYPYGNIKPQEPAEEFGTNLSTFDCVAPLVGDEGGVGQTFSRWIGTMIPQTIPRENHCARAPRIHSPMRRFERFYRNAFYNLSFIATRWTKQGDECR